MAAAIGGLLTTITSSRRDRRGTAAAGLCASLVGLGLARFAYTPLIPAIIAAKWFSPSDVVYLGAANLAGYLAGALLGAAKRGAHWRGMVLAPDDGPRHAVVLCMFRSGFVQSLD